MTTGQFIVLALAATAGAIGYLSFAPLPWDLDPAVDPAEITAEKFVKSLGFDVGPLICAEPHLGASECTVRVYNSEKTFSLQCAEQGNTHWHGCRERVSR